MSHEPISIRLSPRQVSRVRNGHPITIKHEHIGVQGHVFRHLHPLNLQKLVRAHKQKKGVRFHLTAEELHGTGILDTIKKIGSTVLDVATPLASAYNPALAPAIMAGRQGVRQLTGVGLRSNKRKSSRATREEGEGLREFAHSIGKKASKLYQSAKKSGLLTRAADELEHQAVLHYPQYEELAHLGRQQVKQRLGFGVQPLFRHGSGAGLIPAGYSGF